MATMAGEAHISDMVGQGMLKLLANQFQASSSPGYPGMYSSYGSSRPTSTELSHDYFLRNSTQDVKHMLDVVEVVLNYGHAYTMHQLKLNDTLTALSRCDGSATLPTQALYNTV